MAARLPLPTRLQLQTLPSLRNAILGGANTVSNNVITADNVLGFINAMEDDLLSPLRLIWQQVTDKNVVLDVNASFDVRTALSQPIVEIYSVYSTGLSTASPSTNAYPYEISYDRKDINTFRNLQGNLTIKPMYTLDGPIVKLWPSSPLFGQINCKYFTDFARLGDVVSTSTLQIVTLALDGVVSAATQNVNIMFSSNAGAGAVTSVVPVFNGDTAAVVASKIARTPIAYNTDAGGNNSNWLVTNTPGSATLTFAAPIYVATTATLAVTNIPDLGSLTFTFTQTQAPTVDFIQTNWFTQNFPYLYYYGALKHVFLYLNDIERYALASDMANKYVNELQAMSDRADVSDASDNFNINQNVQW